MMMPNLSRLCAAFAICGLMAGCSDSAPTPTAPSSAASAPQANTDKATSEAAGDVTIIASNKLPANAPTVKVVTTGKTRPFSYSETNGSVAGLDVDVITQIGEAQGFNVQIHKQPWQRLFSEVDDGQYDLAISGISFTTERADKYALSDSYVLNPSAMMFTDAALKTKLKDLKSLVQIPNIRIGTLEGSKHAKQLEDLGYHNAQTYKTTYLLFSSLLKNDTDVILQDSILLNQFAKDYPKPKTYAINYETEQEPSAQLVILMAKNNEKLRKSINEGLAKLKANGQLEAIQKKWIPQIDE